MRYSGEREKELLMLKNNKLLDSSQVHVSAMDPAFLYGESLVTTVGVTRGHPEFLDRHLDRILQMANSLDWSFIPSRGDLLHGVSTPKGVIWLSPQNREPSVSFLGGVSVGKNRASSMLPIAPILWRLILKLAWSIFPFRKYRESLFCGS